MALKGQGDPRWIVSTRDDGKNVNNWHWTEADFTAMAKNLLKEKLENHTFENNKIVVKTGTVTMDGEVSVNTRKQKTFLFYEMDVSIQWEGTLKSNGTICKGVAKIPNISDENDEDDFTVSLTVEEENKDRGNLKDELRALIIPFLKEKVPQVIRALRDVTQQHTKLELKQNKPESPDVPKAETPKEILKKEMKPSKESSGPKLISFTVKDKFYCSGMDLFECFLHPGRVRAYAGGDSQIGMKTGDKFKMFGGSVEGENLEIVPGKKIVQKWRFSSWPANHYSTVTIDIDEKGGKSNLTLTQKDVPDSDKDRAEGGWNENFFKRIKGIFGYGPLV